MSEELVSEARHWSIIDMPSHDYTMGLFKRLADRIERLDLALTNAREYSEGVDLQLAEANGAYGALTTIHARYINDIALLGLARDECAASLAAAMKRLDEIHTAAILYLGGEADTSHSAAISLIERIRDIARDQSHDS